MEKRDNNQVSKNKIISGCDGTEGLNKEGGVVERRWGENFSLIVSSEKVKYQLRPEEWKLWEKHSKQEKSVLLYVKVILLISV